MQETKRVGWTQLAQVALKWTGEVDGLPVCSFLKLLDLERGFFLQWAYPSLLKCCGKCTSMKRGVDNVSKRRYDWRRNGLKEVSRDRIKWTNSGMIGKDKFGNFHLRERRGGDRVCICLYEVIISLWCEELVTNCSCFICEENCKVISCRSWWRRRGRRTEKRRESFEKCARVRTVVNFVVVVFRFSSGDIGREGREEWLINT